MFEDLKERQRGFRPKEKARLYVTVAACLVIGALVFGGRGCIEEAPHAAPTAKLTAVPEPTTHPLDVRPLEPLKATCGESNAFDVPALDYLVSEVLTKSLRRDPDLRLAGPADVVALDCKEALGKTIELVGTVRSIDRETDPEHS